jgi:HlyD family secretion protein
MASLFRQRFFPFLLLLVPTLTLADDTPHVVTQPVQRGNIVVTLLEKGELEAVRYADVICKVRSSGRGQNVAGSIRWVIDDGTFVKKGEVLMRLDDSMLREQLKNQEIVVGEKRMLLRQAEKNRELTLKEVEHETRTAEENVELATLELRAALGDAVSQKKARVRLAQAERTRELAKLQGEMKRETAQASVPMPKAALETEETKLKELQEDLENCTIHAPQDGMVTYYVPEASRYGSQQFSPIAVGENVKESQKLFRLPDLSRMQVRIKVHEAHISRLRVGQSAQVRVAGFDQPYTG